MTYVNIWIPQSLLIFVLQVMVLQLAQLVQAFLHKHNVPNLSFYEQMLQNKRCETERRNQEERMRKELAIAEGREEEKDVVSKTF